ncbi:MAG: 50S ribosomal protein L11 [Candidatus Baldrarchaeia archaeon]
MGQKVTVELLVEGGKASAGPPLGPALGPTGVNLYQVVQKINELTKEFAGMKVPVKVTVDKETKEFWVEIGTPPASALILKELKKEKGSGRTGSEIIGDLKMEQVIKIAKMKMKDMFVYSLKAAVKTILGTCVSMGVTVEGKHPKVVQKEIDEGLWDHLLKEE